MCCHDGIDEDLDGYIDCLDHDCLINDPECLAQRFADREEKEGIVSMLETARWAGMFSVDSCGCVEEENNQTTENRISVEFNVTYDPYTGDEGVLWIDYSVSGADMDRYRYLSFKIMDLNSLSVICTELDRYSDGRCTTPC